MVTQDLPRYLIRLYLSWLLTAIATIVTVLALVSWLLDLDELLQVSEYALLLVLPVAAYQLGKVRGSFVRSRPEGERNPKVSAVGRPKQMCRKAFRKTLTDLLELL
jgi:hypothetical protein